MTTPRSPITPSRAEVRRLSMLRTVLHRWWPESRRRYPWRESPEGYPRLVAEVLLQRTRADAVAAIWPGFISRFPSASHLASSTEEEIAVVVQSLGLANKRARNLQRLGTALADADSPPREFDQLLALPGVGPYSAGAYVATWHGERSVPVDSNVIRVLDRVVRGDDRLTKSDARTLLASLMRNGDPETIVFGLVDFGAYPCSPRAPSCEQCPAAAFCVARRARNARSMSSAAPAT